MFDWIQPLDNQLSIWINGVLCHPWLDWFFAHVTDLHKQPWFVVLGVTAAVSFSYQKYNKRCWRVLLALAIAVGCSDLLAYRVIKKQVFRPRPFQNEQIVPSIRKLAVAGGNSFPSNHAANCFAAAVILAAAFPRRRYLFYIFAILIAYSRVYLGVHYVSDVIAGAVIGSTIGWLTARFLMNQLKP